MKKALVYLLTCALAIFVVVLGSEKVLTIKA